MTGTPRATASSMAPVTLPASEHETRMALAPSFTAWAMRWAWICPSSCGGVSQAISIGTPMLAESSLAVVSAPVRAERKIGLVELLAIIAMRMPRDAGGAAAPPAAGGVSPAPGAPPRLHEEHSGHDASA